MIQPWHIITPTSLPSTSSESIRSTVIILPVVRRLRPLRPWKLCQAQPVQGSLAAERRALEARQLCPMLCQQLLPHSVLHSRLIRSGVDPDWIAGSRPSLRASPDPVFNALHDGSFGSRAGARAGVEANTANLAETPETHGTDQDRGRKCCSRDDVKCPGILLEVACQLWRKTVSLWQHVTYRND